LTEREQRAAKLPKFNGIKLDTTPAQMDEFCNILKTDHLPAAMDIIIQSVEGIDVKADNPKIAALHLNKTLQQFSELKPESYLESMLIAQMIQVSNAAGNCMGRVFHEKQTLIGKELNANLAIKFHRTFVAQIEALQKLRGKGGQKVTVEHVHVHEGGQAIVGNVNHAPGGGGKNES
jgi:hypothetical protein